MFPKLFPILLFDDVIQWFNKLLDASVNNYKQFNKLFQYQY